MHRTLLGAIEPTRGTTRAARFLSGRPFRATLEARSGRYRVSRLETGRPMTHAARTVQVARPIEDVFAFLADGENDPKFSARVLEMTKTTDGPPGVGPRFASTVKDAGMKTKREFEYTEFVAPTRIRWAERSKNAVTATGGYDLAPDGAGTRVTIFNELEGHGFGKLVVGFALRSARKGADEFAASIKRAVEAS